MALLDILVHTAVRIRTEGSGDWVEGSRDNAPVEGPTFDCVLFPGTPPREDDNRGRQVRRPTMMYEPYDINDAEFALSGKDEVRVTCDPDEELAVRKAIEGVWQVEGQPQPLGKPGELVKGMLAHVKRISD